MGVKGTRRCKVCGKEYEYCHTFRPTTFRWQDVACCLEHGNEYFAQVAAVRGEKFEGIPGSEPKSAPMAEPKVETKEEPKTWQDTLVVEPKPVEEEDILDLLKVKEDNQESDKVNGKIKQKKLFMSLKNTDIE